MKYLLLYLNGLRNGTGSQLDPHGLHYCSVPFCNQFNQYYLCSGLQQWVIENGETDRITADAATVSRTVEGRGPMK